MRQKLNFNEDWYFHKGDINFVTPDYKAYVYMSAKTERMQTGPACRHYAVTMDEWGGKKEMKGEKWEKVNLPHDFLVNQKPTEDSNGSFGYLPKGNGWYIKNFSLDEKDFEKRITLFFEGVATEAIIYVNGCIVKRNFSGYSPFEVDITDFVKFDEPNRVAVYTKTKDVHEGWWYEGAGIYRSVWLVKTYPIAVDLWGLYVRPEKHEDGWQVCVETTVRNDFYEDKEIVLSGEIIDADGSIVGAFTQMDTIASAGLTTITSNVSVGAPKLWSPNTPHLYIARVRVIENGEEKDCYQTRFGFRTYFIDPNKGLFINGKHYFIKGVCGHADCGIFGKAVPDSVHRYKVQLLKEMGANGYRTAHYMQAEALMDALDENGFIVMDETRWFSSDEESVRQLEMLVKRDRNRPSVFFWSVGNEEPHHITEEGRRICKKLYDRIRRLDSTRLITTAISWAPDRATASEVCDVIGINYDWHLYDTVHEKFPNKGVFCSEGGASGTTRGWYFADDEKHGYISGYDHDLNKSFISRERLWKFALEREWLFGIYQWTSFDHRGESVWPRLCSQSGAFDMFLQKKDAFYQNLSHWTDEPMIHLLPHWNLQGMEDKEIRVVAYTNAPSCELVLNGVSQGKRQVEKGGHAEWGVPYQMGTLQVIAYDEKDKAVAQDSKQTTGIAKKLVLKTDFIGVENNGEKIFLLTCSAQDEQGREVPNACPFVEFNAEGDGEIIGTGSGVSDHVPPKSSDRKMFAGKISVAIKVKKDASSLKIYAHAENLQTGVMEINFKES